MLHQISGDLTTLTGRFVIVQQVNCQNVMGAGLAKALMTRWPQVASEYHAFCVKHTPQTLLGRTPQALLGHIQTTIVGHDQFVCNVFGQLRYGRHGHFTNERALLSACEIIIAHASRAQLPFFVPANLGSGLAGGNREQIQAGLAQLTDRYSADVYLVDFASQVVIPN